MRDARSWDFETMCAAMKELNLYSTEADMSMLFDFLDENGNGVCFCARVCMGVGV